MIINRKNDLFDVVDEHLINENVIIIPHCCNNKKKWGKGFVIPLGEKYPKAKHAFLNDSDHKLGDTMFVVINKRIIIANMIAQTLGTKRPLYYNHLVKCMETVANLYNRIKKNHKCYIICPKFGSGLANGKWEFIYELIIDCWGDMNVVVCSID